MSPTPLPPDPHRSREELLGIVRTRTVVLRRRRRAMLGGTMALVLAVLGGGVALTRGPDSGPSSMRVITEPGGVVQPAPGHESTTTTVTAAPETTTSSSPLGAAATTSTTRSKGTPGPSATSPQPSATVTTVPAGATTTTTTPDAPPECRQSTDPRCGPFRWEPAPEKHPLTVKVSVLTADPVAGKPVQFRVVADELDTVLDTNCYAWEGTGIEGRPACIPAYPPCPDQPKAYGPWAPPEQMPDRFETTPSFTYDKPGTYTLTYTFRTGWSDCSPWSPRDPYANSGTGSVTFTVRSPETPSSTATTTKPEGRN